MQKKEYGNYFSDISFWEKVTSSAKEAGAEALYAALLLYYTVKAPETSKEIKAFAVSALGYFILTPDIIPDLIPFIGFADDLGIISSVLITAKKYITPEIHKQTSEKLGEWFSGHEIESAVSALEPKLK